MGSNSVILLTPLFMPKKVKPVEMVYDSFVPEVKILGDVEKCIRDISVNFDGSPLVGMVWQPLYKEDCLCRGSSPIEFIFQFPEFFEGLEVSIAHGRGDTTHIKNPESFAIRMTGGLELICMRAMMRAMSVKTSDEEIEEAKKMSELSKKKLQKFYKEMPYELYLQTDRWKQLSKLCKYKAGNKCSLCNSTNKLQSHHTTYKNKGSYFDGNPYAKCLELDDLQCLCDTCHTNVHEMAKESGIKIS